MRSFRSVAFAVAWRGIHNAFTNPAILIPSLLFPFFFFTAFAGGLSRVSDVPGFDYPPGYTTFQFAFVFMQSAAFGGIFNGFAIARDFESGFARRLLLAAPQRTGIIAGYAIVALVRWAATISVVTVVALLVGMEVLGSGSTSSASSCSASSSTSPRSSGRPGSPCASGPSRRARSCRCRSSSFSSSRPCMCRSTFSRAGSTLASVNPATFLLEAARSLLAGDPVEVGIAFAIGFGAVGLLSVWALRGLRSAEAAG